MTKELHSAEAAFPIDTAYDAARVLKGPLRFGMSTERLIAALRRLADRLETRDYLVQGVTTTQTAELEDYTMSSFTVRYAEKRKVSPLTEKSLDLTADSDNA